MDSSIKPSAPRVTFLSEERFARMRVRDLVNAFPETLAILTPLGIDLGGGSHSLAAALELNRVPSERVLRDLVMLVGGRVKGGFGSP